MQATEEESSVLKDPVAVVYFEDFGDNPLIFEVIFGCAPVQKED